MANCLPFNAIEHDRVYKAEDWAWYFATFIANGIFPKPSDGLQVIAHNGMELKVNMGYAFINGYAFRNPTGKSIKLDIAEGALHRIDRVVVRWDAPKRDIYITVLKGTPSASPVAAAIKRNTEIWELALADIYVGKGVTRIQTADITDQRFNSGLCGIVKGTIEEIDASVLTKQFDDFFRLYSGNVSVEFRKYIEEMSSNISEMGETWEQWFNNVKEILKNTENGELLSRVIALYEELFQNATEKDIDAIINNTYKEEDEVSSVFSTATYEDIENIINGAYEEQEEEKDIEYKDIDEIVKKLF